jgi:hypothetical protein
MPSTPRPGQGTIYLHVELPFKRQLEEFARDRGQTVAAVVKEALHRHFAFPPPRPEAAPLPPPAPPRPRGRPRKDSRNNP